MSCLTGKETNYFLTMNYLFSIAKLGQVLKAYFECKRPKVDYSKEY